MQPAHLFLVFLAVSTLFWRKTAVEMLEALKITEPGFWLLCLVLYGVLSSYVMPRLFADETYIIPLGASAHLSTSDGAVPLGPVSSNLTQPIYLIGDLFCFLMIATVGSTQRASRRSPPRSSPTRPPISASASSTWSPARPARRRRLQFIRNAQYTFHDEEVVGTMRRIIGSWPEASAFAGMTLGALGFTGMLWLCGRKPSSPAPWRCSRSSSW